MQASGVVKEILTKSWKDKTFYTIKLNGDDAYYNTGSKRPSVSQGDFINFEYTVNGKGYLDVDTKSISQSRDSGVQIGNVKQTAQLSRSVSMNKDDYWKNREERDVETQKRIERQSCRNSAIEFISVLMTAGAIKIPEKQASKETALAEILKMYTDKFIEENKGKPEVVEQAFEPASADVGDGENWQ